MSESTTHPGLPRRLLAEFLGTALLVAAVIGSGIMAQTLSPADVGLALLENTIATGAALFVLIAALGPVSGAHFNPVVTLVDSWLGGIDRRDAIPYIVVQVVGACAGAVLANLMFGLAAVSISTHVRDGSGVLLSEVVATAGLLLVILALVRGGRSSWVPAGVDVLRQSCRHRRPYVVEHVRRNCSIQRSGFRCRADCWRRRRRGDRHCPVAPSVRRTGGRTRRSPRNSVTIRYWVTAR